MDLEWQCHHTIEDLDLLTVVSCADGQIEGVLADVRARQVVALYCSVLEAFGERCRELLAGDVCQLYCMSSVNSIGDFVVLVP